jgi:hypothetical protein
LVFLRSVPRLLVTASVVPSSPVLVALMKDALNSSETRFLQEPYGVTSQKTAFFRYSHLPLLLFMVNVHYFTKKISYLT